MTIEFFHDPNIKGETNFTEDGKNWEPISRMDQNKKRIVFETMRNNELVKTKMDHIRTRYQLGTSDELFNASVPVVFGKLNHVWDYSNGQINPEL